MAQPIPDAVAFRHALGELADRLHADVVRRAARRGARHALTVVGLTFACGTAVTVSAAMGVAVPPHLGPFAIGAAGLAIALAVLAAPCVAALLRRPPDPETAAAWADAVTFGNDRIASALELSREPAPSPFARLAVRDGLEFVRQVAVPRPDVAVVPTRALLVSAAVVCVASTLWLATGWLATGRSRPALGPNPTGQIAFVPPRPTDVGGAAPDLNPSDGPRPFGGADQRSAGPVAGGARASLDRAGDPTAPLQISAVDAASPPQSPVDESATDGGTQSAIGGNGTAPAGQAPPQTHDNAARQAAAPASPAADATPPSAGSQQPAPPSHGTAAAPPVDSHGQQQQQQQGSRSAAAAQKPQDAPAQAAATPHTGRADKANGQGQGGPGEATKRSRGVTPMLLETRLPDVFEGHRGPGPSMRTPVEARPPAAVDDTTVALRPAGAGREQPVAAFQVPPDSRGLVGDYFQAYERAIASDRHQPNGN